MRTTEDLQRLAEARRTLPQPAERRAIRVAAGISRSEVGDACGVTRQAVAMWENGTRMPRGTRLLKYSEALRAIRVGAS
jgi:transcriptional regulator with XRE-family HTH domain